MKAKRVIKWTLLGSVALILTLGGILYLMVRWTPAEYKPQVLTESEKVEVRQDMERRLAAMLDPSGLLDAAAAGVENLKTETTVEVDARTGQRVQVTRTTYDMPLTAEDLNKWIGAMPEASVERLANSGVSAPAIAIGRDRVTFYARVDKFDSVVGMDLGFSFDTDESVKIDVRSSSAGRLPIPDEMVGRYKQTAVDQARNNIQCVSQEAAMFGETGEMAALVVASLGPRLGDALAGKPVTLDINQALGSNVRIRGVKSVDGKLTLDMAAVQRTPLAAEAVARQAAQEP
ncbi:MAG: hypothetical protein GX591_07265 [Planctomycetes bacterium]|nr:hypothetical protein [Planctomycetota bacterium]